MNKKDLILWLALIGLTVSAYLSSESSDGGSTLMFLLLGITAVKFMGVGFQFMELKKAHIFWKFVFISIFLVFTIIALALSRPH